MSIKQLPQDAVDKIKSSVAITSLNGVISGLVRNSLDASASKIYVTLDYAKGNCTVEDSGHGIAPGEFSNDGGLCKLHHTSKYPPSAGVHGRRGDFLAALAALSLLSIASKHVDHRSHNCLLVHNGRMLSRRCPAAPEQRITTFEHGTRVIVHDLFGSLPVRVKQRANVRSDAMALNKAWSELVQFVVALLLPWPSAVLIILRDSIGERELRLQAPSTSESATRTSTLLTQAALAGVENNASWVPVSSSSQMVNVSGCISLHATPTRRSQFLALGTQPIDNTYDTNVLFEEINKVFKTSSFGTNEEPSCSSRSGRALKDWQPRRGPDQHPMFYLRVQVDAPTQEQPTEETLYNSGNQTLELIIGHLRAVCYGFLKNHHFRPQKPIKPPTNSPLSTESILQRCSQSSGLNRRLPASVHHMTPTPSFDRRPESPFDGWNRVKVGLASNARSKGSETSLCNKSRLIGADGTVLRRPMQELDSRAGNDSNYPNRNDDSPQERQGGASESTDDMTSQPGSKAVALRLGKASQALPTKWLSDVVQGWENPVFENVPPTIPAAYEDGPSASREHSHHWSANDEEDVTFNSASIGIRQRLRKEALRGAEVIEQVDKKFILLKVTSDSLQTSGNNAASMLVMLDQHAVDERCRLEELMAGYFVRDSTGAYFPKSEALDGPIAIDMADQEIVLLQQHKEHFANWGILYSIRSSKAMTGEDDFKRTVKITSLPPSIYERCKTEPRLLVDMLREEIWRLNDGGLLSRAQTSAEYDPKHPWVGLFRGCPRGLLELLYSRSCRSAIMFNDALSKDDCSKLLERLSHCAFPFQCAHGRPSMAPLLDLGMEPRIGEWTEEQPVSARTAVWKAWMDST